MVTTIVVRHNYSDVSNSMENVPEIWSKSNTYDLPKLNAFSRTSDRLKSISRHFANYRQYLARRENVMTALSTKKKPALSHILNERR